MKKKGWLAALSIALGISLSLAFASCSPDGFPWNGEQDEDENGKQDEEHGEEGPSLFGVWNSTLVEGGVSLGTTTVIAEVGGATYYVAYSAEADGCPGSCGAVNTAESGFEFVYYPDEDTEVAVPVTLTEEGLTVGSGEQSVFYSSEEKEELPQNAQFPSKLRNEERGVLIDFEGKRFSASVPEVNETVRFVPMGNFVLIGRTRGTAVIYSALFKDGNSYYLWDVPWTAYWNGKLTLTADETPADPVVGQWTGTGHNEGDEAEADYRCDVTLTVYDAGGGVYYYSLLTSFREGETMRYVPNGGKGEKTAEGYEFAQNYGAVGEAGGHLKLTLSGDALTGILSEENSHDVYTVMTFPVADRKPLPSSPTVPSVLSHAEAGVCLDFDERTYTVLYGEYGEPRHDTDVDFIVFGDSALFLAERGGHTEYLAAVGREGKYYFTDDDYIDDWYEYDDYSVLALTEGELPPLDENIVGQWTGTVYMAMSAEDKGVECGEARLTVYDAGGGVYYYGLLMIIRQPDSGYARIPLGGRGEKRGDVYEFMQNPGLENAMFGHVKLSFSGNKLVGTVDEEESEPEYGFAKVVFPVADRTDLPASSSVPSVLSYERAEVTLDFENGSYSVYDPRNDRLINETGIDFIKFGDCAVFLTERYEDAYLAAVGLDGVYYFTEYDFDSYWADYDEYGVVKLTAGRFTPRVSVVFPNGITERVGENSTFADLKEAYSLKNDYFTADGRRCTDGRAFTEKTVLYPALAGRWEGTNTLKPRSQPSESESVLVTLYVVPFVEMGSNGFATFPAEKNGRSENYYTVMKFLFVVQNGDIYETYEGEIGLGTTRDRIEDMYFRCYLGSSQYLEAEFGNDSGTLTLRDAPSADAADSEPFSLTFASVERGASPDPFPSKLYYEDSSHRQLTVDSERKTVTTLLNVVNNEMDSNESAIRFEYGFSDCKFISTESALTFSIGDFFLLRRDGKDFLCQDSVFANREGPSTKFLSSSAMEFTTGRLEETVLVRFSRSLNSYGVRVAKGTKFSELSWLQLKGSFYFVDGTPVDGDTAFNSDCILYRTADTDEIVGVFRGTDGERLYTLTAEAAGGKLYWTLMDKIGNLIGGIVEKSGTSYLLKLGNGTLFTTLTDGGENYTATIDGYSVVFGKDEKQALGASPFVAQNGIDITTEYLGTVYRSRDTNLVIDFQARTCNGKSVELIAVGEQLLLYCEEETAYYVMLFRDIIYVARCNDGNSWNTVQVIGKDR